MTRKESRAIRTSFRVLSMFSSCSMYKEIVGFLRKARLRGWRIRSIWPVQPGPARLTMGRWATDGRAVGEALVIVCDVLGIARNGAVRELTVLLYVRTQRFHYFHCSFTYKRRGLGSIQRGAYQPPWSTITIMWLKVKRLKVSHVECDRHQKLVVSRTIRKQCPLSI